MNRAPIDLQAATRDIKMRCARVCGNLEAIAQSPDVIFADPRKVMLELVLLQHEVEAMQSIMHRGWRP
jgi:hypothetical protein